MVSANNIKEFLFSGYRLDTSQRKLFGAEGLELTISSRAYDTLLVLIINRGETLSKAELIAAVWPTVIVEENNLNQAISSLRKALGDSTSESRFIQTVPGRGYRFVAQLEKLESNHANNDSVAASSLESMSDKSGNNVNGLGLSSVRDSAKKGNSRYQPLVIGAILCCVIALGIGYFFDFFRSGIQAPVEVDLMSANAGVFPSNLQVSIIPDSIAVLPFSNLNPSAENELFSLSLHDEIISQLSKIRSLNVISRDSVVTLSNQQQSVTELGRRLQVESVMTGTILVVEQRARVNLQMLDPNTGVTMWSATYDADTEDFSNMISIQNDIANNVALALEAEINYQEQQEMEAMPTTSFEAYRYNLAARNAYFSQDYKKTWKLTKLALAEDPNYLDALNTFSYVNTVLTAIPLKGLNSHEHYRLALDAANKIIELAPDKSVGYGLRASAYSTNKEWENMAVEVARLKSMGVAPADMKFYALVLMCLGDFAGAIEILEANLLTEPVNLYGRGFLLAAYETAGNRDMARQEYQLGEELNPLWWGDTVNAFLALGRNEPINNLDHLVNLPDSLKHMLGNLDDHENIAAGIQAFIRSDERVSAVVVYYSALAAFIGDPELAISLMKEALNDAWLSFHWLWLPVFDEVRQLDSFKQLLIDADIIDYWQKYGWEDVCQPLEESFSCQWQAYP